MRILMTIHMPVEKTNRVVANGTLGKTIHAILEEQKPEAAYFITQHGKRTGLFVFDLHDVSELPKYAEPWFLAFDATVDVALLMTPQDLEKAAPAIEHAAKMYA